MKTKSADKKAKSKHKPAAGEANVVPHKPLRGRAIFLHLHGYHGSAVKFEQNIKILGAVVEKCFSREVNILITSRGTAKDYERSRSKGTPTSAASPATPSPFNLASIKGLDSPQPDSPGDGASKKPLTRGQSIALAATKSRNHGSGDVFSNAKKWGIKTIHIDQAQKYVQREMEKVPAAAKLTDQAKKLESKDAKPKHKVKRLHGSFIKFESCTRHYRPLTQTFKTYPTININTPCGTCPFELPKKGQSSLPVDRDIERAEREERDKNGDEEEEGAGLKQLEEGDTGNTGELKSPNNEVRNNSRSKVKDGKRDGYRTDDRQKLVSRKSGVSSGYEPSKLFTRGELRRIMIDKIRADLKRGYCEACEVKYEDIDKHVRSDHHRRFARDSSNYASLDQLIVQGPNMEQFLNDVITFQGLHQTEAINESQDDVLLLTEVTSPRTPRQTTDRNKSPRITTPVSGISCSRQLRKTANTNPQNQPKLAVRLFDEVAHVTTDVTNSPSKKIIGKDPTNSPGNRSVTKDSVNSPSKRSMTKDLVNSHSETSVTKDLVSSLSKRYVTKDLVNSPGKRSIHSPLRSTRQHRPEKLTTSNSGHDKERETSECIVIDSDDGRDKETNSARLGSHIKGLAPALTHKHSKKPEKLSANDSMNESRKGQLVKEMKSLLGCHYTLVVESPRRAQLNALNKTEQDLDINRPGESDVTRHRAPSGSHDNHPSSSTEVGHRPGKSTLPGKSTNDADCVTRSTPAIKPTPRESGTESHRNSSSSRKMRDRSNSVQSEGQISRSDVLDQSNLKEHSEAMKFRKRNMRERAVIKLKAKEVLQVDKEDDISVSVDNNVSNRHSNNLPKLSKDFDGICLPESATSKSQMIPSKVSRASRRMKDPTRDMSTKDVLDVAEESVQLGLSRAPNSRCTRSVSVSRRDCDEAAKPATQSVSHDPNIKQAPSKDAQISKHVASKFKSPISPNKRPEITRSQSTSQSNTAVATSPEPSHIDITAMSPWDRRPGYLMGNASPRLVISPLNDIKIKQLSHTIDSNEGRPNHAKTINQRSPMKTILKGDGVKSPLKKVKFQEHRAAAAVVSGSESGYKANGDTKVSNDDDVILRRVRSARSCHRNTESSHSPHKSGFIQLRATHHGKKKTLVLVSKEPSHKSSDMKTTNTTLPTGPSTQQVPENQGDTSKSPSKLSDLDVITISPSTRRNMRIRLRSPWRVASKRSISQLLSSEEDEPEFAGFDSRSQSVSDLPTDMSYEEVSEVDIEDRSDEEWIIDERLDVEEDSDAVRLIGDPRPDGLGHDHHDDIVPASDNSTDTQPSSPIKLPPINKHILGDVIPTADMKQTLRLPLYSRHRRTPVRDESQHEVYDADFSSPLKVPCVEHLFQDSPGKGSDPSECWDTKIDSYLNQVSEGSILVGHRSQGQGHSLIHDPCDPVRRMSPRKPRRNPLQELDQCIPGKQESMWVSSPKANSSLAGRCHSPRKRHCSARNTPSKTNRGVTIGGPKHCSTPCRSGMTEFVGEENVNTNRKQPTGKSCVDGQATVDCTWFNLDDEIQLKSVTDDAHSSQPDTLPSPSSGSRSKVRRSLKPQILRMSPRKASPSVDAFQFDSSDSISSSVLKARSGASRPGGSSKVCGLSSHIGGNNFNYLQLTKKFKTLTDQMSPKPGQSPVHVRSASKSTQSTHVSGQSAPRYKNSQKSYDCDVAFKSHSKRRKSLGDVPQGAGRKCALFESPKKVDRGAKECMMYSPDADNSKHVVPKLTPNSKLKLKYERVSSPKPSKNRSTTKYKSTASTMSHMVPVISPNKKAALITSKASSVNLDNLSYQAKTARLPRKRKHSESRARSPSSKHSRSRQKLSSSKGVSRHR